MRIDQDIWTCDDEREQLWQTDPGRAARLAFIDTMGLWDEQVQDGEFGGVPCFHTTVTKMDDARLGDAQTQPSGVREVTPDSNAGVWVVPGRIRDRWAKAA